MGGLSLLLDLHQRRPLVTNSSQRTTATPPPTPPARLKTRPTPPESPPQNIQQLSGCPQQATWTSMLLQQSQRTLSTLSRLEHLTWASREPTSPALALKHQSSLPRPRLRTPAPRTGTRCPSSRLLSSRLSTTAPCLRNMSPRPLMSLKTLPSLTKLKMLLR